MNAEKRIAVVGSGISGLISAYLLQQKYQVCLLEKNSVVGGHSRTLMVEDENKEIPVDTGFIVFNRENYPTLCKLFEKLAVPSKPSCMSFGVSIDVSEANSQRSRLEYGTVPLKNIFAQTRNLFSAAHWKMLRDIKRFNREAENLLSASENPSLGEFLQANSYSDAFVERFILPMAASIWSTAPGDINAFPAKHLVRFFSNHGLLNPSERKQWRTVEGGSKEYISRLLAGFEGEVKTDIHIEKIVRRQGEVELHLAGGEIEIYDQLVLACHSDQSLELLGESATQDESSILGDIRYQTNEVILHTDPSLMPQNPKCWQSWNYISESSSWGEPRVCLSYWMNRLQSIESSAPLIVSLNPDRMPDQHLVKDKWTTAHPIFDQKAIEAQKELSRIQGKNRTWYAGAWQGYGFHEDGAYSGLCVAEALGCDLSL